MNITNDKNGKTSSKRIAGLFVGIPVMLILTGFGIAKFDVLQYLIVWSSFTGASLGLGVLERTGK